MGHMGRMTAQMDEIVRHFIQGQQVWDLGAGNLYYAKHLLALGAKHVVAVDKAGFQRTLYQGHNITPVERCFEDVLVPTGGIRVAWVSWPSNYHLHGLLDILEASDVVIYLGSNTEGSACGWPGMYNHFHSREALAHVPFRRNTLAVYGRLLAEEERRSLLGEEVAALGGRCMRFGESEDRANSMGQLTSTDCRV